ncbi:MAG TPA: hypothetical protein VGW11_06175 [Solirubrobacteraceae bacterium]|nr:hypothetical protein [Solirubrobacteraceae bacterium]
MGPVAFADVLLAVLGIENDGLNLAVNLLLLFLAIIWVALIYWTYTDARRRIADPMLVGCATAASLFPFVGTVIYMIIRPPEFLEDAYEREVSIESSETLIRVLKDLQASQAEMHASVQRLEQAMQAGRRRAAARAAQQREGSGGGERQPAAERRAT